MDAVRRGLAAERAGTDACLGAERATEDARTERTWENQLHGSDNLIDRDRLLADAQLVRFREDTNEKLFRERTRVDAAVAALVETKDALAHAHIEQAHRTDAFAMVAHDLRNPLSIITMNAEIIAGSTKEADTREAAQEVQVAAARMERLLADLLDVARIESGTLRIFKREHDVDAFLAEVVRCYRPLFEARGMTLAVELPGHPLTAWFDHDRIVQVLSNLLGNAMKFTPPGRTVHLCMGQRGTDLEFVVRDTGPGIAANHLPHVFKRFWQLNHNTQSGLGLGLYICDKIIEAHAGRIWVESTPGEGSTFRFTLPAGRESLDLPSPPRSSH